jgi:hypothetical protein
MAWRSSNVDEANRLSISVGTSAAREAFSPVEHPMPAITLKADIHRHGGDVRFVPTNRHGPLFDHLVGEGEHMGGVVWLNAAAVLRLRTSVNGVGRKTGMLAEFGKTARYCATASHRF